MLKLPGTQTDGGFALHWKVQSGGSLGCKEQSRGGERDVPGSERLRTDSSENTKKDLVEQREMWREKRDEARGTDWKPGEEGFPGEGAWLPRPRSRRHG